MNINTTFITSDTHYGHSKIIQYSNRPFKNVDEMDEALIFNHNSKVRSSDTVIHVGDFAFAEANRVKQILDRLNGKMIFIPGNHDKVFVKNPQLFDRFENAAALREISKNSNSSNLGLHMELTYYSGKMRNSIFISHYCNLVWNKSHRGALMLHGHSHGSLRHPYPMRAMDIGVDPQHYFPVKLAAAVKLLEAIPIHKVDHH